MFAIGYDIGSSSIKAALVDLSNFKRVEVVQFPEKEMSIQAPQQAWAEQDPEIWWQALCKATQALLAKHPVVKTKLVSIGIAYQMHGLVLVDKDQKLLRPAIIWCDSRATGIGAEAAKKLGDDYCFSNLLNSPGNFTAAKLKWVKDKEPAIFEKIHKILLPGDYIAMKLSGELNTTVQGLSEGIFWDFKKNKTADRLMNHFGFDTELIPDLVENFSDQGRVHQQAAVATGLPTNLPITYRAGDQPNNALALGVLEPGEVAATGGTSGVVYGIASQPKNFPNSGVNSFAHVNHRADKPRIGQLLCINGAGSQYAWMRNQISGENTTYAELEAMITAIPIGTEDLTIIPFGNGAERMIGNKMTGAQINNLQFNVHTRAHLIRAALEGIAFSFVYGIHLLKKLGISPEVIRVGNDNLFQSEIFSMCIANLLACDIQMKDTTGAVGAGLASGPGVNAYSDLKMAFANENVVKTYRANDQKEEHEQAYGKWKSDLLKLIN